MRSLLRPSLLLCLAVGALSACGDEVESAPARPAAQTAATGAPWERIPPDSLYGATAMENIRTVPAVIDALNIPAGWNGMRIAAVSDLVLGLWEDNEEVAAAAIRRAVEANPDLIVLLGDYVISIGDTAALGRVLQPLQGRQVLAVLGDRDIRSDSLATAVTRTLTQRGIRVLRNDAVPFERNGETALIGGVDPELVDRSFADREYILATMGTQGARPRVLLTHNPLVAAAAPDNRFDAVLAGHTYCGQVEVPGTPRLSWLVGEGLPGAAVPGTERLFRMDGNTVFVTCGVGYSFLPVRVGAQPEVALITLESVAPAEPTEAAPDTIIPDSLMQRFQRDTTAARDTGTG